MGKGLSSIQFETAWQAPLATSLMLLLSACGEPRLFPAPQVVQEKIASVKVVEYCPTDGYTLTEIFAFNGSSYLKGDRHIADFDRDGMPDETERENTMMTTFGISFVKADTNDDGYSDLVTQLIGYTTATQSQLRSCANPFQDTDYDLLTDCEEALLRTDFKSPDSDRDGIPDGYEIRFGTNPNDNMDSITDLDQDQLVNLMEIKFNLLPKQTNTQGIKNRSLRYQVETYRSEPSSSTGLSTDCYNITIGNIGLMDVSNGNLVKIHALESKTLVGQGDVLRLKTANVLIPQDQLHDKSRLVIKDLNHQTVDGVIIPWIVEDGEED